MIQSITEKNKNEGSISEVIRIGIPLMLIASSNSIKLFCDRMMLAHYNKGDMSASFAIGTTFFTLLIFFISIISYSSVLVSQYYGRGNHKKVGLTTWQALICACIAFIFIGSGYWWAEPLFDYIGYDSSFSPSRIKYGNILFASSLFPLLMTALTAFWGGRGKTWIVLSIEGVTVILNVVFNFLLIFGTTSLPDSIIADTGLYSFRSCVNSLWAFAGLPHIPEMGIVGAAVGTAASMAIGTAVAFLLFLHKKNRDEFGTLPDKLFDVPILNKLLRLGIPCGIRAVLGLGAFNIFILLLARYGDVVRNASTITFTINALVFIPLFGLGRSVSILVGRSIGADRIEVAHRSVKNGMIILVGYLLFVVTILVLFEQLPLSLFDISNSTTYLCTTRFITFLSFTLVMNGIAILYSSAICAAGDTAFPMKVTILLSWGLSAIPMLIIYLLGGSCHSLWAVFILHTIPKAGLFYWRYRSGKWQDMQVIEMNIESEAELV